MMAFMAFFFPQAPSGSRYIDTGSQDVLPCGAGRPELRGKLCWHFPFQVSVEHFRAKMAEHFLKSFFLLLSSQDFGSMADGSMLVSEYLSEQFE